MLYKANGEAVRIIQDRGHGWLQIQTPSGHTEEVSLCTLRADQGLAELLHAIRATGQPCASLRDYRITEGPNGFKLELKDP